MSESRSAVSCTSSVLVRESMPMLPRSDSSDWTAAAFADQRRKLLGLRVVDLEVFRTQRGEFLEVLARRKLRLLARSDFFCGRDQDDIVLAAHVQTLGLEHDVERLIPRDVLQAQRHVALYRIADDDVLTAGVGEQLQHSARFDVLEVQGEAFAGIFLLRPRVHRRVS